MALKIHSWTEPSGQKYQDGKGTYSVGNLIARAKGLPVQEMPIEHLNIHNLGFKSDSMHDLVKHMRVVLNADLSYPIILDDEGYVMDGRHRIAKVLLEGLDTIKFVRFEKTPPPDYYEGSED